MVARAKFSSFPIQNKSGIFAHACSRLGGSLKAGAPLVPKRSSFQGDRRSSRGCLLREGPKQSFKSGNDAEFGREATTGSENSRVTRMLGTAFVGMSSQKLWDCQGWEKCWQRAPEEGGWRLWLQEGRAGVGACTGRCRGLSAQRSCMELLLWSKICWNADTPIPE